MANVELLTFARSLAAKCSITPPTAPVEIGVQFVSNLYERICQPYLEDPPILPVLSIQPGEHLAAILESLSCNFLNLDLDPLLRVEDLLAGDERSLLLLFRIFDNLYDCLVQSPAPDHAGAVATETGSAGKKPSASRAQHIGPMYMGRRIVDIRSASVIYSPRTAALRRMKRSKSAQEAATHRGRPQKPITMVEATEATAAKKFRSGGAMSVDGIRLDKDLSARTPKAHSTLTRHRAVAEKRLARIAVVAAKASIRNSCARKRHISALTKRAIGNLRSKSTSNHLKLEYAKEKARKVLLQQIRDSTSATAENAYRIRLLAELGESVEIGTKSQAELSEERAARDMEVRSLLSEISSYLFC